MSIIRVENLYKSYGKLSVLNGINLEISEGDIYTIIGSSGSGKSTLLRCIINLEDIDSGSIFIDEKLFIKDGVFAVDKKEVVDMKLKMGMVFQNFNLFPHLTVGENLKLPCKLVNKIGKAELQNRAEELLNKVGLIDKMNSYPVSLSGGQKQRVAIVRALMMNPEIMLFDEPTSSLDPEITGEVLETMRSLAKENMTMIIVTHEISFAKEISDKVIFMHNGVVEEIGSPKTVLQSPQSEVLKKFLKNVK